MKQIFSFGMLALVLTTSNSSVFAKETIDKTITLAEHENAEAQYELASRYEKGDGVKKNIDSALKWYLKAADNGHTGAQVDLGWFYQNGQFVKKDMEKAIALYTKAASQGNPQAQLNLAVLYDEGIGVPKDDLLAIKWYKFAADQGSDIAQLNLGIKYWRGEGIVQDYEKAWNLFNYVRMKSLNKKVKWRARSILDSIKRELDVSNRFGNFDYPSWERIITKTH